MAAVFDTNNLTDTKTAVPDAGNDNHVAIAGDDASWSSKKDEEFIKGSDSGQRQTLIKTADEIINIQKNQKTTVKGNMTTIVLSGDQANIVETGSQTNTVKQKIVIESEASEIEIKAKTKITLDVGASRLTMDAAGNINIQGCNIQINGTATIRAESPDTDIF